MSHNQFSTLGVEPEFLAVLTKNQITQPSPIQEQSIPEILEGHDLLGIAKTGTGKTLAFCLPLIQNIKNLGGKALIIAPTRELAYQVDKVCKDFLLGTHMYSGVIVGGAPIYKQITQIKKGLDIVIATPGRLIDHLERGTINFSKFKYLVLDEADRLFDMGFAPQIDTIMKALPDQSERQSLLFSATMPDEISKLIKEHLNQPVSVEIASSGDTSEHISQEMIIVDKKHHMSALLACLKKTQDTVLVFSRTKRGASRLVKTLRENNYASEELHSDRSLYQRRKAIEAIKNGHSRILVATDIAARGIDIKNLNTVINYDLPENPEDYIHRIGRTGRAGEKGKAITLVISDQGSEMRRIQKFINSDIETVELNDIPSAQLEFKVSSKQRNFRRRPNSSSRTRSGNFRRR